MPPFAEKQTQLFGPTGEPQEETDREQSSRSARVFQDFLLRESIWAIKEAANFDELQTFRNHLNEGLPQNSAKTRERYAQSILRWFFSDGSTRGFATRTWVAFADDALLIDIIRFLYLQGEPLIGDCVASALYPIANESLIPHSYLHEFVSNRTGQQSAKTNKRLKASLRKLGVLTRAKSTHDHLKPLRPSPMSLFLVFHYLFANAAVRTVEMRAVLANPFWKYLGCKSEDEVRRVFRDADNAGHLGKYVVADQLELVTPKHVLADLLNQRIRV